MAAVAALLEAQRHDLLLALLSEEAGACALDSPGPPTSSSTSSFPGSALAQRLIALADTVTRRDDGVPCRLPTCLLVHLFRRLQRQWCAMSLYHVDQCQCIDQLLLLLLLSPLVNAMPQGLVALADTNTPVMMVRSQTINTWQKHQTWAYHSFCFIMLWRFRNSAGVAPDLLDKVLRPCRWGTGGHACAGAAHWRRQWRSGGSGGGSSGSIRGVAAAGAGGMTLLRRALGLRRNTTPIL